MPRFIDRDEVRRLVDTEQAVVADVLPRASYDRAHLAGAVHLPYRGWEVERVRARLDRERPVIVYCNDHQ